MSDFSQYYDVQRFELHKSQISDDFVYWFKKGEDIFQAVFRKKSLKCLSYTGECHIYYIICHIKVDSTNHIMMYSTNNSLAAYIRENIIYHRKDFFYI